jgi:hypothetical protein
LCGGKAVRKKRRRKGFFQERQSKTGITQKKPSGNKKQKSKKYGQ